MKRIGLALAALVLTAGVALAQGGGGGGSSGGGSAGGGSSGSGSASTGGTAGGTGGTSATPSAGTGGSGSTGVPGSTVNGPNNAGGPVPGASTLQPSDNATVGRAPGVNPANPQDASRRANPSDRSLPGASNPQDMRAFPSSVPQIIAPERK